jgi:hypothetical protein
MSDLPFDYEPAPANLGAAPKKCRRHVWMVEQQTGHSYCHLCGWHRDPQRSRLGRNNRKRGNGHELAVARKYGGRKVGPLAGPWDIEGLSYASQVKTHRGMPPQWLVAPRSRVEPPAARGAAIYMTHLTIPKWGIDDHVYGYHLAPRRWDGLFAAMAHASRTPRLIERYLMPGVPARDFLVVKAEDDPAALVRDAAYVVYDGDAWLDLFGRDEERVA